MMDAPQLPPKNIFFRLSQSVAALCLLALATQPSNLHAQENSVVPPAPTPTIAPKTVTPEQPPLPPRVVKAMKPQLPENPVAQPQKGQKPLDGAKWAIQITPSNAKKVNVNEKSYEAVYNSIPYRRSEYLANPSYRHDTTVEIMFGQMRNTVVHRTDTPQRIVNPRPNIYEPRLYREMEFWNYPGRFFRYFPGFSPLVNPLF
ncbi:hypothetical protein Mal48_04920 [Thalassoglobus polymorphus]|uniref:Uncharacterized protein n=1 Tax=Thalassoglobus polymorphus TaxID=2527994 RepID=A0A517QHZ6_9PLAN|nr:hypothetical protein Mal48_04920 [Thalassoglobus polymorphus]